MFPLRQIYSGLTFSIQADGFRSLPLVSLAGNVGITLWSSWRELLYDFRVACNENLYHLIAALRRAVKYE